MSNPVVLLPNARTIFVNANGTPLAGGSVGMYVPGTLVAKNTWRDSAGTALNANPIPLGADGGALIWGSGVYRQILKDKSGNTIWDQLTVAPQIGAGGQAVVLDTVAQLQGSSIASTVNAIQLSGYRAAGDGGSGLWKRVAAGPASVGVVQSSDGSWWGVTATGGAIYVEQAGAFPGALSSDSYAAFSFCLTNFPYVKTQALAYYLSTGITIPDGTTLEGDAFLPNLQALEGAQLQFANTVATCVQIGSGNTNNGAGLVNMIVNRQGSTPPASTIGVLVFEGQSPVLRNVGSVNHAVCIEWLVNSGSPAGITCHARGIYTAGATDAHIVVNTWPELFITQMRTGCNGSVDQNCTSHFRITGGGSGGNGPNTIELAQWQMNQGQNTATYGIQFVNLTNTASNAVEFRFAQGHMEGIGTACIMSDSTCTYLNRLNLTDTMFNCPSATALALDPGTQPSDVMISGCLFATPTFTINSTVAPNRLNIVNSYLATTCTLNVPSNSTMNVTNCGFANLVLNGAGNMVFAACNLTGGTFTNNSTGKVIVVSSNFSATQTWVPTVQFGGANVGVTYSVQSGDYEWISVDMMRVGISLLLTNKGSSTGNLTISNLPAQGNGSFGTGSGGSPGVYSGFTGLTGALVLAGAANSTVLSFYQTGATGVTAITNSGATNTMAVNADFLLRTV